MPSKIWPSGFAGTTPLYDDRARARPERHRAAGRQARRTSAKPALRERPLGHRRWPRAELAWGPDIFKETDDAMVMCCRPLATFVAFSKDGYDDDADADADYIGNADDHDHPDHNADAGNQYLQPSATSAYRHHRSRQHHYHHSSSPSSSPSSSSSVSLSLS